MNGATRKKKIWLIRLVRYLGLMITIGCILLTIFFHLPIELAFLLGLIGIIMMASANKIDFGYSTTVELNGIPVPPLREPDTEYTSNGIIVTATKIKLDENKDTPDKLMPKNEGE